MRKARGKRQNAKGKSQRQRQKAKGKGTNRIRDASSLERNVSCLEVVVVVVVVAVVACRRGLAQMPLHRITPAASLPERAAADEPARNG